VSILVTPQTSRSRFRASPLIWRRTLNSVSAMGHPKIVAWRQAGQRGASGSKTKVPVFDTVAEAMKQTGAKRLRQYLFRHPFAAETRFWRRGAAVSRLRGLASPRGFRWKLNMVKVKARNGKGKKSTPHRPNCPGVSHRVGGARTHTAVPGFGHLGRDTFTRRNCRAWSRRRAARHLRSGSGNDVSPGSGSPLGAVGIAGETVKMKTSHSGDVIRMSMPIRNQRGLL